MKLLNIYEQFLRIFSTDSAADKMRARAVYMIGWAVILTQIFNVAAMSLSYREWTLDHNIALIACAYVLVLIHILRFTKKFYLFTAGYTLLIFGGIAASAFQEATGINTALLPLMITGVIMSGFISGWRMVISYSVVSVTFIWLLYGVSTSAGPALPVDMDIYDARNLQRAVQASIAFVLVALIVSIFSYNMYKLFDTLEESAQKARAADASKSLFMANMSHELRTPLNGVIGMSELLLRTELNPTQKQYAQIVNGCSTGLVTIINDVLDLSRLDAGKITIKSDYFDFRAMITSLTELNRPAAMKKNIQLQLQYDVNVPSQIFADQGRLRQVTSNLIGNAVKFTEHGAVEIFVKGVQSTPDIFSLNVFVRDSGIGIPKTDIDRIFDRFEQVDNSLASEKQGTGLGLAIAKEMIEAMGGGMSVQSILGGGSLFSYTLNTSTASTETVWQETPAIMATPIPMDKAS